MELRYKLPAKAVEIMEELASEELNQVSFYMHLSFCCSNRGFYRAADRFMDMSRNERYNFTRFNDFLETRGEEMDVPAVKAPTNDFKDLRDGVEAAYRLEIDITEKYAEATKSMHDVDLMAYLKLCEFFAFQQHELFYLHKMWQTFKDVETEEGQREQEVSFFGSGDEKTAAPIV